MSRPDGEPDAAIALRRQMEQFFNVTTDAVFFLDREYRFTFMNRRSRELVSPDGAVLGQNLFEAFPATVYPDSPFVKNYRRSMEEGLSGEFESYYAPLNLWLRVQSYPAADGIVVFFRDFSEERESQQELQSKNEESERQRAEIESLYRTAPIGLALFDVEDFRYLRLNDRQAAFFGLKPEEVVGKTLTEMAPIEGLRELFEQVRDGHPVVNHLLEGEVVTHPGEHRYWTVSYYPVYAADGTITNITAASLEITQQRRAEQALIQSEKLAIVGRLASSIAHEINNPLESVTNLLYLARHSEGVEDIRMYLDMAELELRRVAAITSHTLRFHKQSTSPHEAAIEALLETVLSIHQGRLMNAHVQVASRHHTTRSVRCFEGEIRQVLSNLIGNAIDAMPNGGRLLLRTRQNTHRPSGRNGITVTIADTGMGMSPGTLQRLFEPFFTTKGLSGTGLGLWVSHEIVERHEGVLHARSSQRPGKSGTVFTLFLPYRAVQR